MAYSRALYLKVPRQTVTAKAYYGERLLQLGPLAYANFREITGWQPEECEAVLVHLRRKHIAEQINGKWRLKVPDAREQ